LTPASTFHLATRSRGRYESAGTAPTYNAALKPRHSLPDLSLSVASAPPTIVLGSRLQFITDPTALTGVLLGGGWRDEGSQAFRGLGRVGRKGVRSASLGLPLVPDGARWITGGSIPVDGGSKV